MSVIDEKQGNTNKMTFADFDKLNLKSFAENLFQIMEKGVVSSVGEQGAYTISLNAEFGNGKTTFLKMFEDFIREKRQGYDVLFINAWESDFYKEPVVIILSEFANYIKKNSKGKNEKIKTETINKVLRGVGSIANQIMQNKVGLNVKEILDSYRDEENNSEKEEVVGNAILEDFNERKETIEKVREVISEYAKAGKKLIVVIDELDRTRPDHAIRFLEDMKHFFDIENVVFLAAVNRKQMEATVKCLYGKDLDFNGYYRKFFKQEIDLPDPYKEVWKFVDGLIQKTKVKYNQNDKSDRVKNAYLSCKIFRLTLREIQLFIRIFEIILGSEKEITKLVYMDAYSFFICCFIKEKEFFYKILKGKVDVRDFLSFVDNKKVAYNSDENYLLGQTAYSFCTKEFQNIHETAHVTKDVDIQIIEDTFPEVKGFASWILSPTQEGFTVDYGQPALRICEKISQFKSALD